MIELVRSVWAEPRPAKPPPPRWLDWGLVGALVVIAIVEGAARTGLTARWEWVAVAIVSAPTLVWRRSRPLPMLAIAFGLGAVASVVLRGEPPLNTFVFLLLLPFSLYRWGSGREVVIGSAVVLGKVGLSVALGYLSPGSALGGFAVLSATAAVATAVRYRARARTRELDQVKLLERERLARDLHDTVAHHVSAMAIRAQAGLATMSLEPNAAADALRVIESEASRTLAEMRTMVRALRRDLPAELAPNPGIAELEQLAGRGREGPVVSVEIAGELDGIPPPIGTAIYRLAQESITNARRHARHATRIEVRVAADETSVHLRVSDDGETNHARSTATPGYGLIGMIERAALLGGTCEAGPNPVRGWTVTAVLPRTGART